MANVAVDYDDAMLFTTFNAMFLDLYNAFTFLNTIYVGETRALLVLVECKYMCMYAIAVYYLKRYLKTESI